MVADLAILVPAALQERARARGARPVVRVDRVSPGRRGRPAAVQAARHRGLSRLVAAAVPDEHDVAETVDGEAPGRGFENALEDRLRNRDRSRVAHVPGRRGEPAFRHVGQHGRHQGATEGAGDRCAERLHPDVVLAERHVRSILFGASRRHDDGGGSGSDEIPHFRPGQLLEEDGGRGLRPAGRRRQERPRHQSQDRACSHDTPSRALSVPGPTVTSAGARGAGVFRRRVYQRFPRRPKERCGPGGWVPLPGAGRPEGAWRDGGNGQPGPGCRAGPRRGRPDGCPAPPIARRRSGGPTPPAPLAGSGGRRERPVRTIDYNHQGAGGRPARETG